MPPPIGHGAALFLPRPFSYALCRYRGEMAETTKLIPTRDVAERYNRSPRLVRKLAQDGVLPAVRLTERGHLLFRVEDVERLIERGRDTREAA